MQIQDEAALPGVLRATTLESSTTAGAHDAVIVGGGAAGGMAALSLTEAGLRVLVLDAGWSQTTRHSSWSRMTHAAARRLADPETLRLVPSMAVPLGRIALRGLGWFRQPVQSRCSVWGRTPEAFVDDRDCPYQTSPGQPFIWIRARQLGGRVVIPGHGRQYYRLSPSDFAPVDGLSPPWPLAPGELDPWYSLVERRLGLAGAYDGIPWQPDSELSRVLEPTADEGALMGAIAARWPGTRPMLGRFAPPLDSLEAAARTGRLQCRQGATAKEIDVDRSGRVRGVVWLDQQSGAEARVAAPIVILCASTLESTRLLMLSRSSRSPEGLGGASGALGRNLMDHVYLTGWADGPSLHSDATREEGRSIYLPRFDARDAPAAGPGRGFSVLLYQFPGRRGHSHLTALTSGEMLPRPDNCATLHPRRRDAWGIPILRIQCAHGDAELARARDQVTAIHDLAAATGSTLNRFNHRPAAPGAAIHECGTARMGGDPRDSVLDPHSQCWEAQGLYVTDGACFPSQGSQNPTLTILALTARACHHAVTSS